MNYEIPMLVEILYYDFSHELVPESRSGGNDDLMLSHRLTSRLSVRPMSQSIDTS